MKGKLLILILLQE